MKVSRKWIIIAALVLGVQGTQRSRRSYKQFGSMIELRTKFSLKDFNGYGNFCGFRGSGRPVDNLDRCCEGHDKCLKHSNRKYCQPLFYLSFFVMPYRWQHIYHPDFDVLLCSNSNSRCQRGLCECDKEAADCFAVFQDEYNPAYKRRKRLYVF